jgi:hypothetical protein
MLITLCILAETKTLIMKTFNITRFINELQDLSPREAIDEIASAGLTNDEIANCVKTIWLNPTFKFNK